MWKTKVQRPPLPQSVHPAAVWQMHSLRCQMTAPSLLLSDRCTRCCAVRRQQLHSSQTVRLLNLSSKLPCEYLLASFLVFVLCVFAHSGSTISKSSVSSWKVTFSFKWRILEYLCGVASLDDRLKTSLRVNIWCWVKRQYHNNHIIPACLIRTIKGHVKTSFYRTFCTPFNQLFFKLIKCESCLSLTATDLLHYSQYLSV